MIIDGKEINELELIKRESKLVEMLLPSPLLQLLQRVNSFFIQGFVSMQGECRPLIVCGHQVGVITPNVAFYLADYPDVFTETPAAFYLNSQFDTYKGRSDAIDIVLRNLRAKGSLLALTGWREECFNVWSDFGAEPLFKIERSAATVFGVRAFGVHVNGYTRLQDGNFGVWVQKRAANKPTWPGMLDTMVGGGITAGLTPSQVLLKESAEEASIPEEIVRTAASAGTLSFFAETERGLHANTEFVYDLELPPDFIPRNSDGEVEGFELVPIQELLGLVLSSKYKMTSAPVAIGFLIRRGLINSETEANLPAVQELLHLPLSYFFRQWPVNCVTNGSSTSSLLLPPTPPVS